MENNIEKSFCDIFKELRLEKKLSQDKIAVELDVSQSLINKWENNQSTPAPEMLEYIADYFDISTDYLIGRTNDRRYYNHNNKNNKIVNILYNKVKELPEDKQKMILSITEAVMSDIDNQLDNK